VDRGLVVLTGLWNLTEVNVSDTTTEYQITLFLKIALAVTSGVAAAVHQVGRSKAALAIGGALGLLSALAAMFLGYLLTTGNRPGVPFPPISSAAAHPALVSAPLSQAGDDARVDELEPKPSRLRGLLNV
jgi:hypothetical protein